MNITTPATRIALASAFLVLAACGDADTGEETAIPMDTAPAMDTMAQPGSPMTDRTATARLSPTEGNDVEGTVTFTASDGAIEVRADLTGLGEGRHGFHIHETGDCSAPDATSAGGHFAPEGSRHGSSDQRPPEAHVGDMGNITADASGNATYEGTFDDMALDGPRGIVGKAVIVHAGADDLTSQPTGNAGARVACGVIEEGGGM